MESPRIRKFFQNPLDFPPAGWRMVCLHAGTARKRPPGKEEKDMSIAAIAAIFLVMVLSAALPLGIMLLLHKRGGRWFPFLVGMVTFSLFALGLEQSVHAMVLRSSLGEMITGNIWLYALYGGLAAGIFEELGRFAAFKLVLRESGRRSALCYGAGHGGVEALLLVGLTMANNLMLALTINRGGALPPEAEAAAAQLAAVPAGMFLWAGFERAVAIGLHMANSVLVYTAATHPGRGWLLPAAIAIHAGVNFLAVVLNAQVGVLAAELATLAATALAILLAAGIYKNLPESEESP